MKNKDYFQDCQTVTLEQMLEAREKRAKLQGQLIQKYKSSLIAFTLNIPGEVKIYPLAERAFCEGLHKIESELQRCHSEILHKRIRKKISGYEAYFLVSRDAVELKSILLRLEEKHPIGRFFDIDIFDARGIPQKGSKFGRRERSCFICGKPVWECSRSRAHSIEELKNHTADQFAIYFRETFIDEVSTSAIRALLYEVSVSPKPGLVDRFNNGAHQDMDYFTFMDSITSLIPYFRKITMKSMDYEGSADSLLQELSSIGVEAEQKMFEATKGINTHKGVIFSMGILCAAAGYLFERNSHISVTLLLDTAGEIAQSAMLNFRKNQGQSQTHGENVFHQYQLTGVRGEAVKGFPNVRNCGYPKLKQLYNEGKSINNAGILTLLHLMIEVDDTNIVHRSNDETLMDIKNKIRGKLNRDENTLDLLQIAEDFNTDFVRRNISPGGSADLLSLSFFLLFLIDKPVFERMGTTVKMNRKK